MIEKFLGHYFGMRQGSAGEFVLRFEQGRADNAIEVTTDIDSVVRLVNDAMNEAKLPVRVLLDLPDDDRNQ